MLRLRVASRASRLSLAQVEEAMRYLSQRLGGLEYEVVAVKTLGDAVRDRPIHEIGRVGVFEKEVDRAVLEGRADVAVHSMKDLPTRLPDGLVIAAVPPRGDVRDSIVPPPRGGLEGARVGTSSLRRSALVRLHYPGARVELLRGNLDTRLRRLAEGRYDYIVVAEAGLRRLGARVERRPLDPLEWPPAPGQGLLAVVAPEDSRLAGLLARATHRPSHAMAEAERALLAALGAGCRLPVGGFSYVKGETIVVLGAYVDPQRGVVWARAKAGLERAREAGMEAGHRLARLVEGAGGAADGLKL